MVAKDIMRARVFTLSPDQPLSEAADLLLSRRISGAPVVGRGRKVLGVLSRSDIVRRAHEQERGRVPAFFYEGDQLMMAEPCRTLGRAAVREIMTPMVLSVPPDMPVERVAKLMLAKRIHRVIVTDDGVLRGVISSLDLIRGLLKRRPRI